MAAISRVFPTILYALMATGPLLIWSEQFPNPPYAFVRTQSAEELALRGRPIAYRFFLDALENNRLYKQGLIGWLKTRFPNEVTASQDDAGVIAFLKSRLQP